MSQKLPNRPPATKRPAPPPATPRVALPRVQFRPLLVSGMVATSNAGVLVLIDSEQPEQEQLIALWHETLHLLGLRDEAQVEAFAQRLAQACPEILATVKAAAAAVLPEVLLVRRSHAELDADEACPPRRLVL